MTTAVPNTPKLPLSDFTLRENFDTFEVELRIRGEVVFSNGEYRATATHAQRIYGLTDDELMELYRAYKDDYDSAR